MLNYKHHEVVKYEMDPASNYTNDLYDYRAFEYDSNWQPVALASD